MTHQHFMSEKKVNLTTSHIINFILYLYQINASAPENYKTGFSNNSPIQYCTVLLRVLNIANVLSANYIFLKTAVTVCQEPNKVKLDLIQFISCLCLFGASVHSLSHLHNISQITQYCTLIHSLSCLSVFINQGQRKDEKKKQIKQQIGQYTTMAANGGHTCGASLNHRCPLHKSALLLELLWPQLDG